MSDIQLFQSDEFGTLRTFVEGEEVSFVANDVCAILDLGNPRTSLALLDEDEKGVHSVDTPGGAQDMTVITESGFYRLVMKSRKPEAKAFQRWVTHDVLPAVRRHGGYLTPQRVEDILSDPDTIIRLAQDLKAERERTRRLSLENASMRPKVDFYERVMESDGLISVRAAAKVLKSYDNGMGERRLREALRERGMVEKRTTRATSQAIERRYMKERPFTIRHKDGREEYSSYGCLTPKGLDWCIRNFCHQQRLEIA